MKGGRKSRDEREKVSKEVLSTIQIRVPKSLNISENNGRKAEEGKHEPLSSEAF